MKAIVYTKYGSPEFLELKEIEKPIPGDDEVLIKVTTASLNSWDLDLLFGKPYAFRIFSGIFKPRVQILGCDVAGVVESVGKSVKDFKPGDEVFGDISGNGMGAFAEYVCTREDILAHKPANLTFEAAAALPQAGVLALQGLRYKGEMQAGQKILLNGAGGGVGTFALQIAKLHGAEVTCVDRAEKLPMLLSLGADYVIDYESEDYTANTYDLILDVVGNRSIFDNKKALKYVMVGGPLGRILKLVILGPWLSLTENKKMGILLHRPNRLDLEHLAELMGNEQIKAIIDKVYPLSQLNIAMHHFSQGKVQGKIIVQVSEG